MAKKTKKEEVVDKKKEVSLFQKTLDMISDEHGDKIVKSLPDMVSEPEVGISTGSLWLDWAINPSAGGMVLGQTIELYGPYSSGKTTIALGLCANATANKRHAVFFDAEHALKAPSVINAGVDEKYFTRIRNRDGRKVAKVLEQLIKTGEAGIVVVDSIPAWKPLQDPKKGEDEVDFTKPKMAFSASFISEALPYLNALASEHDVVLVLLNQVRKNLSGYGASEMPFGGEVIKHTDSVRLKLSGKASSSVDRIVDAQGNLVGQYTTVLCDKNKTSIPMRSVKLPLFLGRGVHPYMEVALISVELGIVEGGGGRYKFADTGENIAHGMNQFTQALWDDRDLYFNLRQKCIDKLGIKYSKDTLVVNSFHDQDCNIRDAVMSAPATQEDLDE